MQNLKPQIVAAREAALRMLECEEHRAAAELKDLLTADDDLFIGVLSGNLSTPVRDDGDLQTRVRKSFYDTLYLLFLGFHVGEYGVAMKGIDAFVAAFVAGFESAADANAGSIVPGGVDDDVWHALLATGW